MKQIFVSSVQKEFARERLAIKRMIETDPIIKPHFKAFVFEEDAPASDKTTQQVFLDEIARSDVYLVLVGDEYGHCEDGELSPTEVEFDKAQELGLTKLVMVRGKDNTRRTPRETQFLDKISRDRVRVRYQNRDSANAFDDLLDEIRNSIRDLMIDDGVLSEVPYEDQTPADVTWDEIDSGRVGWFVDSAMRNRKAEYSPAMSVSDVLRSLHLLNRKTQMPTNAAVLLFGKDVQDRFPSSAVKCVCFDGMEKTKPSADIALLGGDLFQLADAALSFVKRHLRNGAGEHLAGAVAADALELPNSVIAEAINNAIAHRNYSSCASVQVEVYRDRVEVINPGRLHPSLTVEDLYRKHESLPPNLRIAHAMYQAKYIEALGTGITDLLLKCRKCGLKKPLIEEEAGRFRIVIWRPEPENKLEMIASKVIECFRKDPKISIRRLADGVGAENKDVKKAIQTLRDAGLLVREGAKRNGSWRIVELQKKTKNENENSAIQIP